MPINSGAETQHQGDLKSASLLRARSFQELLDSLPAGAYTCDRDGLITYFNQHSVQLWGRTPKLNDPEDRFCGSFKLFLADGKPIKHEECWMARALKTGQDFNGQEIIVQRPDGSRLTVLAHANPLHDEQGQLLGAVNVLIDISDRKRAEEVQARLASIVESSDDAIISKTVDGIILSWNTGAQRLFGYTPEDAIGSPILLIIPPERIDEENAILSRLRRGERIEHYETVRLTKDGRRIDISLTISPLFDSYGRVIGVSKVAREITARKHAEDTLIALKDELSMQLADLRRLHEMSVRLSTTLDLDAILNETLRTATAIKGTDLGLLFLCDQEEQQLHLRASVGFSDEYLKLIETIPADFGAVGTAFQERQRVVIEDIEIDPSFKAQRELARQAGIRAVHCTPLITRSGKAIGVLTTHFRRPHRPSGREIHLIDLCARQAVDYIENARLYAELREADRRKDEFLATLAHELRNPLAPISNSLQLLKLADDLNPSVQKVRDVMERQVNHMVRLVDDLMEVSRITRGKIELRTAPIELAAVVSSAVETSRPLIEAAGHQLAIKLPSDPIILQADAVRLSQVISNLLNNAAKYTQQGGQIWINARREGQEAVISVRDNGVGILSEMLPRVFDMFAQIDQTINRSQGGLGIGLTLAKKLVQMHGGQIEAHSAGSGKGSEFVIRLPVISGPRPIEKPPAPSAKQSFPTRRILVVDDTQAAAYMLGKLLETMGQKVQTVNSAAAALASARQDPPDVVISDIAMPEMDGYELARRLRQEPRLKNVVLVALTGYGQDSDKQRASDAGFDRHLVKPVGLDTLQQLLGALAQPVGVTTRR